MTSDITNECNEGKHRADHQSAGASPAAMMVSPISTPGICRMQPARAAKSTIKKERIWEERRQIARVQGWDVNEKLRSEVDSLPTPETACNSSNSRTYPNPDDAHSKAGQVILLILFITQVRDGVLEHNKEGHTDDS